MPFVANSYPTINLHLLRNKRCSVLSALVFFVFIKQHVPAASNLLFLKPCLFSEKNARCGPPALQGGVAGASQGGFAVPGKMFGEDGLMDAIFGGVYRRSRAEARSG
jgi:hypothetical protein